MRPICCFREVSYKFTKKSFQIFEKGFLAKMRLDVLDKQATTELAYWADDIYLCLTSHYINPYARRLIKLQIGLILRPEQLFKK